MSKPVLQAKMIGYAPDASGDPIAPNEVVYQCHEPRRPKTTLYERFHVLLGLAGGVYIAWLLIERAVQTLF